VLPGAGEDEWVEEAGLVVIEMSDVQWVYVLEEAGSEKEVTGVRGKREGLVGMKTVNRVEAVGQADPGTGAAVLRKGGEHGKGELISLGRFRPGGLKN
jgi:putative intracellular protease/amidase